MKTGRMLLAVTAMLGTAAHAADYYASAGVLQDSLESSEVNSGFGGGLQLGAWVDEHVAIEADYRYRRATYRVFDGHVTRHTGDGNILYTFTNNDLWRPYIGVGIGFSKTRQFNHFGTDAEGSIALGLLYNLDKNWKVRAEITHYQIFATDGIDENMVMLGFQYNYKP